MRDKGIKILFNCDIVGCVGSDCVSPIVTDIDNDAATATKTLRASKLVDSQGQEIDFDECFWCTQASAQSWLKQTDLETTQDGFVCVSSTLESVNVPGVFACGDIAHLTESPRPKAGVFAVRAG